MVGSRFEFLWVLSLFSNTCSLFYVSIKIKSVIKNCLKDIPFPIELPWHLCWKSTGPFLDPVLLQWTICLSLNNSRHSDRLLNYYSFVFIFEVKYRISPSVMFFVKITLTFHGSLNSHRNPKISLSTWTKMPIGILICIVLNLGKILTI